MSSVIRIGTRESQLAVWQASQVRNRLQQNGHAAELVYIKSEGDTDLQTPLYAMGVQGVFTRNLDMALLQNKIDIAVHSMKDVPVQLAQGIAQAAVLSRGNYKDIIVLNRDIPSPDFSNIKDVVIATSSVRRKAQWLHRYPHHTLTDIRGNVNTRLKKLYDSHWQGAIFAAAGLERIGLRPANSIDLDWMLPAPAQGTIMVCARENDEETIGHCKVLNDENTAMTVKIERDFLSALLGGCATPISALAIIENNKIHFEGNMAMPDGSDMAAVEEIFDIKDLEQAGKLAAATILQKGGKAIMEKMNHA